MAIQGINTESRDKAGMPSQLKHANKQLLGTSKKRNTGKYDSLLF